MWAFHVPIASPGGRALRPGSLTGRRARETTPTGRETCVLLTAPLRRVRKHTATGSQHTVQRLQCSYTVRPHQDGPFQNLPSLHRAMGPCLSSPSAHTARSRQPAVSLRGGAACSGHVPSPVAAARGPWLLPGSTVASGAVTSEQMQPPEASFASVPPASTLSACRKGPHGVSHSAVCSGEGSWAPDHSERTEDPPQLLSGLFPRVMKASGVSWGNYCLGGTSMLP